MPADVQETRDHGNRNDPDIAVVLLIMDYIHRNMGLHTNLTFDTSAEPFYSSYTLGQSTMYSVGNELIYPDKVLNKSAKERSLAQLGGASLINSLISLSALSHDVKGLSSWLSATCDDKWPEIQDVYNKSPDCLCIQFQRQI